MRNQNFIFVAFCLVLVSGLLEVRYLLTPWFSEERFLRRELELTENKLENEKLQVALERDRFTDLQNEVASLNLNIKDSKYQWISGLRMPASGSLTISSQLLFSEASRSFSEKKYEQAAKGLKDLLGKYPASSKSAEARFLLGESYFQMAQFGDCLDQVDAMMNLYPESRLTGFLMVRMAQILTAQRQEGRAEEIYNLILNQFANEKDLRVQAEELRAKLVK